MKIKAVSIILTVFLMLSMCIPVMGADGNQYIENPFDTTMFKVLENISESNLQAQYDKLLGYKAGKYNETIMSLDGNMTIESFKINFQSLNEPTSSEYFLIGYNGSDLYPNVHIKVVENGYGYMAEWTNTAPITLKAIYKIDFNYNFREEPIPEEPEEPEEPPITVKLNDREMIFDQPPIIEEGRTLVPLRTIAEALCLNVQWQEETQTILLSKENDNTEITLTIDSTEVKKNEETITLEVPAKIVNGRTLVPLRFIAECFNVSVGWNEETITVYLTSN